MKEVEEGNGLSKAQGQASGTAQVTATAEVVAPDVSLKGADTGESAKADDTNDNPQANEPDTTQESILNSNISDSPTAEDSLGFGPYVTAIADFLTRPSTVPPLTLSVEGEWGSGKSSFMMQLEKQLSRKGERTIEFNAWRHDKEDALWAAFALEFLLKLSRRLPLSRRWIAHTKLLILRFRWREGWLDVLRAGAICILFITVTAGGGLLLYLKGSSWIEGVVLGQNNLSWRSILQGLIASGGIAGSVAVIVSLLVKLKGLVGNPLAFEIKKYVESPDYQTRIAFIERFHEDFNRIVKAYAGDNRVYVFIDDLDRCEVPKAADLMQALNLMISDAQKLIFIIGMDREKIAAGLAVKYEKLLPYLAPAPSAPATTTKGSFDSLGGLEYGYSFIEKFIQLPFLVPQPSESDFKRLLNRINSDARDDPTEDKQEQKERRERIKIDVTGDSQMVRNIVLMVAPAFDYNPRRLKQFVNSFRLRTFIASETSLFEDPEDPENYDPLTLEQLGKYVAISLRWPLLLADLDDNCELLARLQMLAVERSDDEVELADSPDIAFRWLKRKKLRSLLRYGFDSKRSRDKRRYSLEKLDVDKLLQVSPQKRRAAQAERTAASPQSSTAPSGKEPPKQARRKPDEAVKKVDRKGSPGRRRPRLPE